jgi:hypothetical protein
LDLNGSSNRRKRNYPRTSFKICNEIKDNKTDWMRSTHGYFGGKISCEETFFLGDKGLEGE